MAEQSRWQPQSLVAQGLGRIEPATGAVTPPVHVSTTYLRDPDNAYRRGFDYARDSHPGYRDAEELLARLEQGSRALLFASGMAAATAVFLAFDPGDHFVAPEVMYWGLRKWLKQTVTRLGYRVTFVDMTDPAAVRAAMTDRTRLVWVETPANPTWAIADIAALADIAHAGGAELAVDNTVPTPVLTRPLTLGADIVMHSATKYLNGHGDVVAGVLVTASEDEHWSRIHTLRHDGGGILGGFEAWLLLRGMRTLYPRVQGACGNAMHIAAALEHHPAVERVLYPGLPTHRGHTLAARQMEGGFGGMLSIIVRGGEAAAIDTASRVSLWKRATSLGGVESLIEHRASIEGQGSPAAPGLLRLSVGLEAADDLLADLKEALAAIQSS